MSELCEREMEGEVSFSLNCETNNSCLVWWRNLIMWCTYLINPRRRKFGSNEMAMRVYKCMCVCVLACVYWGVVNTAAQHTIGWLKEKHCRKLYKAITNSFTFFSDIWFTIEPFSAFSVSQAQRGGPTGSINTCGCFNIANDEQWWTTIPPFQKKKNGHHLDT